LCIFISIPSYLYPDILKQNSTSNDSFVYLIRQSDLNIQTENLIFKLSFYTQAIPAKIIPCCLLSIFIPLIIYNLVVFKKKKQRLLRKYSSIVGILKFFQIIIFIFSNIYFFIFIKEKKKNS
jgi:hypothetical protein